MKKLLIILIFFSLSCSHEMEKDKQGTHKFNGIYEEEYLNRIAFPMGGMGAGMVCLEGTGAFSHVSLRHHPDLFKEPRTFAAISLKGQQENITRVLEGPVPKWKIFGNL